MTLEEVTYPEGRRPDCPICDQPLTGLREEKGRAAGGWSGHPVILLKAQPCGCLVDEHAHALQMHLDEETEMVTWTPSR